MQPFVRQVRFGSRVTLGLADGGTDIDVMVSRKNKKQVFVTRMGGQNTTDTERETPLSSDIVGVSDIVGHET
jgi:hypothetical protein